MRRDDLDLEKRDDTTLQGNLHALQKGIATAQSWAQEWLKDDHTYQADKLGRRIVRIATRARLYLAEIRARVEKDSWQGEILDNLEAMYHSTMANVCNALQEVETSDWEQSDHGPDTPTTVRSGFEAAASEGPQSLVQVGETAHEPGFKRRYRSPSTGSDGSRATGRPPSKRLAYGGLLHPDDASARASIEFAGTQFGGGSADPLYPPTLGPDSAFNSAPSSRKPSITPE
jgi:hypothetical protein